MKKISLLVVLAAFLAVPGISHALMEMGVGGWEQNIEGDLSYNEFNTIVPGADVEVDLENDLGIDNETRPYGWLKMGMPSILPNLYLGYTPMEFDGKSRRSRDFVFGRYTFNAGTELDTTVELNHFDVGLYGSIPFLNLASLKKLNIDLGLNLRVADLDAEITGTTTVGGVDVVRTESESYTLPIPMIYAAVQVTPIEKLSLEVEARGISLQGNHLFSAVGKVKAKMFGPMFVAGGYRYDDIYLDEDDIELDSTISGPFVETGIDF